MKIGDKLTGRITGIQPYGAFVELETFYPYSGRGKTSIAKTETFFK